jgi:hypothetical protein
MKIIIIIIITTVLVSDMKEIANALLSSSRNLCLLYINIYNYKFSLLIHMFNSRAAHKHTKRERERDAYRQLKNHIKSLLPL